MWPIVTDRVAWSELIAMHIGLRTRVGWRNHGDPDPPWEGAILKGKGVARFKLQEHPAVSCPKTAEPVEMPFGWYARMSHRNHVLDRIQIPYGKG